MTAGIPIYMDNLSATDRCVKCGLCLPHCPTFMLTGNEADSPRGRISLIQWLDDSAEISPGLLTHIDRCLQCGACEAMCPSKVPFGALMDTARTRLAPQHHSGFPGRVVTRISTKLLASPRALQLAGPLLGGYRRSGLPVLLGKLPGIAGRLNRLVAGTTTAKTDPGRQYSPHRSEVATRVHLFPGCTGHALDQQTLDDTQHLLRTLGYDAVINKNTACCGALQQHTGHPNTAASLAAINRAALNDNLPIISIASGCTAHLQHYDALDIDGTSTSFSPRVSEVMAFLARQDPLSLCFDPCEYPVGIYMPCTQRNALQQSQAVFEVLNWIPGLEIHTINPQGGCCGAAGNYMLTQAEFSDALGDAVVERIIDRQVRTLLTTNIGCSLHLQTRLRKQGIKIELIHPVTLLRRQLSG